MSNNDIRSIVWLEGSIEKKDGTEIDLDNLQDEFIEWIENKGLLFCGITKHMTEEEV